MDINFEIPGNKDELLKGGCDRYYVKDLIVKKLVVVKLKDARVALREDGPEFILEYFDLYFSVLYHGDSLQMDIVTSAYKDLHKAMHDLNNNLNFLLEDKDGISEELRLKFLNVMKMLVYLYTNIVIFMENKMRTIEKQTIQVKGRGRAKSDSADDIYNFKKIDVLLTLNNILQKDIHIFWDPPVVEGIFTKMISDVCYAFLENPSIKPSKDIRVEIFNILGTLIKSHNQDASFVFLSIQLLKSCDHLVNCLAEGIQILVENYNCKTLVQKFVGDMAEWLTNQEFQDNQGTRNCTAVLVEMAVLMPNLMITEIMNLTNCLEMDSYMLRNCVLTIITELILAVLTKPDMNEEEKESRDEFLSVLEEHMDDVSAHVRSRVFQHWSRLHAETAIPLKMQHDILKKAVLHLKDKVATVRKSAAACVTQFLTHNLYGAKLNLKLINEELESKSKLLDALKTEVDATQNKILDALKEKWSKVEDEVRKAVKTMLEDNDDKEPTNGEISQKDMANIVRLYLDDGKIVEAVALARGGAVSFNEWNKMRETMDTQEQINFYVTYICSIYLNMNGALHLNGVNITDEDLKRLEELSKSVDFLKDASQFLQLINDAIKPMAELLMSVSSSDAQEAANFFVSAYKFNLDNAMDGVLELLRVMQTNEQERKDIVINAFKTIFLTTDATSNLEHAKTIVDRLIHLLQTVSVNQYENLKLVISMWTSKGILDNSIIDVLWQYFTKKIEVTNVESCAALHLLYLASLGRKTIITRNIKLVTSIAFAEQENYDLLLVKTACDILAVAGERPNITAKEAPFTIASDDPIWNDLLKIFYKTFGKSVPFYNIAVTSAINFIYKVCSKPDAICDQFLSRLVELVSNKKEVKTFVAMRMIHIFGEVALKNLNFLDDSVYKELKRRSFIKEELDIEKKGDQNKKKKKRRSNVADSASKSISSIMNGSTLNDSKLADDETVLEGAQAEDIEAEFILHVLENDSVNGTGGLAKMAPLIKYYCEENNVDEDLKTTAVGALLRYMLVSSKFCTQNLKLIFTHLEKTTNSDVKCTILYHCSDLLERFPNAVEPWSPKIYLRLKDSDDKVRIAAFKVLSNLILRDMILAHGHVAEMAWCLVDKNETLKSMSKHFFNLLANKSNNLYNVLPDIFSHLCDSEEMDETDLRHIMKFLFGLISKTRQMENLVERFCSKFALTQDIKKVLNITYCLTLVTFNEKGMAKLLDSFGLYKHFVYDSDFYTMLKQILTGASKLNNNQVKNIITEIEEKIQGIFEMDGENNPAEARNNQTQSSGTFKKPKGRPLRKRQKKTVGSDEEDIEIDKENNVSNTSVRKSTRKRTPRGRKAIDSDGDDSD